MAIDIDWVKEQMTKAKVRQSAGTSVLRLMDLWNEMNHTPESAKDAIDIFSKLALGIAIAPTEIDELKGTWIAAQPGQIKVADVVRVHLDAFTGELGSIHNGRVGKVVGVRYGDIIVKTIDDRDPLLDGAHYSPHMLDKLIRS